MHNFSHIMFQIILAIDLFSGLVLSWLVMIAEPKNEGLGGQIGSTTATSSFKGLAGKDERLMIQTRNVAIVFFVASILVAIGTGRW